MKLLVKLGGTLLDEAASRDRLAAEIAEVVGEGHQVVVVHGGGKQLTRFLAEKGLQSNFIRGFRVTTPETLDGVIKVLAGQVNTELVAALVRAGARAVGLTGADDGLVGAVQLEADLGAVGRVEQVRAGLLDLLTANGYVPVVACLAGGREGVVYNVNADQFAAALAQGYGAERLMFLTDVDGVLEGDGGRIAELTTGEALELIEQGVAKGGMEAKLRACAGAVEGGVGEVRIVAGARAGAVREAVRRAGAGTAIRPGASR